MTQDGASISEVPLVFPGLVASSRRFVVNATNGSISRATNTNEGSSTAEPSYYDASAESERLCGSASISSLRIGRAQEEAVVTTSALPSEPEVLSVALSWKSGSGAVMSPMSVELDLGRDEPFCPVKVQCFAYGTSPVDDSSIVVAMVDVKGTILSLRLEVETLEPLASSVKICSVPALLESSRTDRDLDDMGTYETELHSTMVVFLSSTVVVIAFSPWLLAVDIGASKIALWSETQCLEEMKNRQNMLGNIRTKAIDMLLGRDDEELNDMPPTAALCVCSSENNSVDDSGSSYDVFSLHSDASLRRWRVDPSWASLEPYEVNRLEIPDQNTHMGKPLLPAPSVWSHSLNSVSLCARLYESIYTLAIHIQTNGTDLLSTANQSNCRLAVLHGSQDTGTVSSGVVQSSLHLSVPEGVSSLVGMDFVPGVQRCSLRALFQSGPLSSAGESLSDSTPLVTYPPSIVSIVSTQPLLAPSEHTLDGVARSERDRISSLTFDMCLRRDDTSSTSIDDDIHELDTQFMKYLFRPAYPRGTGTVLAPSADSIQKALCKLVPGHALDMDRDMSIELETLRAMHAWRNIENRGGGLLSTPTVARGSPTTPTSDAASVYQGYVTIENDSNGQNETSENMDVEDYETDDEEQQERSSQVAAHENRWKRFLLTVWDEEHVLRTPVCFALLPSAQELSEAVLVRVGVTSVLASALFETTTSSNADSTWHTLDRAAIALLGRIRKQQDQSDKLYAVETSLWDIIAKARLLLPSPSVEARKVDAINQLHSLGAWSLRDDEAQDWDTSSNEVTLDAIQRVLDTVSGEDLISWLEHSPVSFGSDEAEVSGSLPGLSLVSSFTAESTGSIQGMWTGHIPSTSTRHTACSLSVQCVDSVRRLQLGRCLLLLGMGKQEYSMETALLVDSVQHAVFRAYLHSLSVLWTSSQLVPMPSAAVQASHPSALPLGTLPRSTAVGASSPSGPPPAKRASYGDPAASTGLVSTQSKSGDAKMTTALDAHIIYLAQKMSETLSAMQTPLGAPIALACAFLRSSFDFGGSASNEMDVRKSSIPLPELGALPPPADESVASDYPRLALRLIAPFIAYPPATDSVHLTCARREAAAECLLIESNAVSRTGSMNESQQREMRRKACELLVPAGIDSDHLSAAGLEQIELAFDVLRTKALAASSQRYAIPEDERPQDQDSEGVLASALQRLIHEGEDDPALPIAARADIWRLCGLDIVRSIFVPLFSSIPPNVQKDFSALGLDRETLDGVRSLAQSLLRLSNLMHRLAVLERHMSTVGRIVASKAPSSSDMLLKCIESTIYEMTQIFPPIVYRSMEEYATLWSMMFRHAMTGHRWKKAYEACVNNPRVDRKINNYRRLVVGMVDSGALGDLLDECIVLSSSPMDKGNIVERDTDSTTSSLLVESVDSCVDLYEIAAETLADAYQGGAYYDDSTASQSNSAMSFGTTDYRGCLYALHASMGHWRRAAQAMDMRYQTANMRLAACKEAELDASSREGLVIEDLSLGALGASHAVQLISDPALRFIVSGELGPYPILPLLDDAAGVDPANLQRNKRGRGPQPERLFRSSEGMESTTDAGMGSKDRLSRFMTARDLSSRAVRAMAIRAIVLDGSTAATVAPVFFQSDSASVDSDRGVIASLAALGYYQLAFLLAKTMRDSYEERTGGSCLNGHDIFYDSVSFILCSYLVPVAVRSSRPPHLALEPGGDSFSIPGRPTYAQLCGTSDEIGTKSDSIQSHVLGDTWRMKRLVPESAKEAVATSLVRKLTIAQSGSDNTIALEVAACLLDLDPRRARLPSWAERLLLGRDCSDCDTRGLFSPRVKSGSSVSSPPCSFSGDPSALVRLYMKRDMFVDASNVVTAVLLGTDVEGKTESSREKEAPSRLPEKGDIDFVPYGTINVLWNLIDSALGSLTTDATEKEKLKKARERMEKALEMHFRLMKISEMGMQSARIVS